MQRVTLEALTRNVNSEKNKKLRLEGQIPAIVYGHLKENLPVKLDKKLFLKNMKGHLDSLIFIDLKISGDKEASKTVLIKDIQKDAIKNEIDHIDFLEITAGEKIHISVPVHLTGEALGVVTYGGVLEWFLRSIDIECLPKDMPEDIKVDISHLNLGQSIHVSDLKLAEGIKVLSSPEATVAMVAAKKEEEAAAPAAEAKPEATAAAAPASKAPASK